MVKAIKDTESSRLGRKKMRFCQKSYQLWTSKTKY